MHLRYEVIALCGLLSLNATASGKSRPMAEMHGGCSDYKMNVSAEMSAWEKDSHDVESSSKEALPISRKLKLELQDQSKVGFFRAPGKSFPVQGNPKGGVFTFVAPRAGALRVSAGSKLWFDIVDLESKTALEAVEFEMQTGCDRIFKVVVFNVVKDRQYALQVSSSARSDANFLLTMAP